MSNFKMFPSLADLDSVFELRTETDPSAPPTKLYYPGGNDLCLRYKMYTSGTQAAKTRYNVIQPDGSFKDLNEIFAPPPKGITWVAMGSGVAEGLYSQFNRVNTTFALDNSNVYVGGNFDNVGNDTLKRNIAKWDGITWYALSTSTSAYVISIYAVDKTNVYVGGAFSLAADVPNTRYIARWDGATWRAMSTGMSSGNVNAISAVDNSNVYVGGNFTSARGVANTSCVARWDGDTWRAMSTGIGSGSVNAISAVDNSNVYVGGNFINLGSANGDNIARWDGATWRAMGTGASSSVYAISAVDNSNVYVGGAFTTVGGVANTKYIAKWNGSAWQAMGTGITFTNGYVNAISALDNSNVYVGGDFTNIGGDTNKKYITRWTNNY